MSEPDGRAIQFDYDTERQVLRVTLPGGRVVTHIGVPAAVHEGLSSAAAPGLYYNERIRDRFGRA